MDIASITALREPQAWPHPVTEVELIETHISWVLLTGEFAYKIKKPVDFGFLDFSSLDKRKHYCEEELRLNRRLAPELYLEVVTINGEPDAPVVGGEGAVLEYAVRMRQFDTGAGFDQLLARGELGAAHIDQTAAVIAAFHAATAVAPPAGEYGSPAAVAAPVLENFAQMQPELDTQLTDEYLRQQFELLERWSRAACEKYEAVFAARLAEGFVRECHGDLHLRNLVYWQGEVLPFDCIEFNPALRWIDVISELAFLLMDLDDHGRPDFAGRLLNAYLEVTGDYRGLQLLRFYQVYRALVRAKVESLRLAQQSNADPQAAAEMAKYIALAAGYTRPGQARLLITHGLSGSGKTTVSQRLLEEAGFIRLRSDVERKRLFGLAPLERSGSGAAAGIYRPQASEQTYARLLALAEQLLDWGLPVLVDAAFLQAEQRAPFREAARRRGIPFAIAHCETTVAVLRERVAARSARSDDASEADLTILEAQLEHREPLTDSEQAAVIAIDTSAELELGQALAFAAD